MLIFGTIYLLTFFIAFFMGTYVLYKDVKSKLNWLFFLFIFTIGQDALWEFFLLISETREYAMLWCRPISIWPLILAFWLHFIYCFINEDKKRAPILILLLFYIPSFTFIILTYIPGFIEMSVVLTRYGWSYILGNREHIASRMISVWTSIVSIWLVGFSFYNYNHIKEKHKKKQVLFILMGSIIMTLGAIISNAIIPNIGERIPNTTMFGFLFGSVLLGVGVWKYQIFNVSIANAAEIIVDAMPEALFLLNSENKIIETNPSSVQLTGINSKRLKATSFLDLFHEDAKEMVNVKLLNQMSTSDVSYLSDIMILSDGGDSTPVALTFSTIKDEKGEFQGIICMAKDLREIKKSELENQVLQSQLYQSQKMESIGRLAGGIAHDFNNMLAAISGYADMIHRKFAEGNPKLEKYIGIIQSAAGRSAELTSKLLAFARKGNIELKILNVHEAITEAVSILEHTLGKNVKLEILLSADNSIIYADMSQLQNMFLNFCVNSRDAMPDGGKLTIKTEDVTLENYFDKIGNKKLVDGNYVKVSFGDSGIGMSEEVIEKIFEPFFTTKEQGKGTGLGLASAYGTVQSLNGSIDVESSLGEGTTFNIYIPSTEDELEEHMIEDTANLKAVDGKVLIVDDEDLVRSVSIDMCRNLGYVPISASNARDALHYYRKNKEDISLVVLDMIMPEMDGAECYARLLEMNDNIKVVFASGYTRDENMDTLLKNPNTRFLQKPFKSKELGRALSELIV